MPEKDYYAVLGVAPTATAEQIRQAYRRLSHEFHPDVSDHADATVRFQEINEANEVLSHEAKRREYDRRHRRAAGDSDRSGRAAPNGAGPRRDPGDNAGAGRTPPKGARAKPGMENKGQTRQRPAGPNRRNQEYRRPADHAHASGGYEDQDQSRPPEDAGHQRSQSPYEAQYEQEYRARVTGELIEWERQQRVAANSRIEELRYQEERARIVRRNQEEQEREERWHQFEQELQQRRSQEEAQRQERLSRLELEIQRRRQQEEQEREERRIVEEQERQWRRTQEEQERQARLRQEV